MIIEEIIKLKTSNEDPDTKRKIQRLQQELDEIENEEENPKDI